MTDWKNISEIYKDVFKNVTEKLESFEMEVTGGVPPILREPLYIVVPMSIIYVLIFLTGLIGNISTCIVIAKNKSMHTATNYYLFSLAVSDLLLLVSGLPPEITRLWWPHVYVYGEIFCSFQSFLAETSANATVLTITAFTIERYIAICHPFLTHTVSKLSRAVKFVMAIWILALCLAVPQAIPYGVRYEKDTLGNEVTSCTITKSLMTYAFELSTFVFFVGPMTLITVLYVCISVKLRQSRNLSVTVRNEENSTPRCSRSQLAQNRVIKMLVAVVVAFFVCWAPFHSQRLLAIYITNVWQSKPPPILLTLYIFLNYVSGVLYFLSTCVNPLLYNIMSNKFRAAFKTTLATLFDRGRNHRSMHHRTYSTLSRCAPSLRNYQRSVSDANGQQLSTQNNIIKTSNVPVTDSVIQMNQAPPKKYFRTRMNSESSQTTVLTSISRSLQTDAKNKKNTTKSRENRKLNKLRSPPLLINNFAQKFKTFGRYKEENNQEVFCHQKSSGSATISNSSLQDMDENEFSSSDLVKFMGEVNQDLSYVN